MKNLQKISQIKSFQSDYLAHSLNLELFSDSSCDLNADFQNILRSRQHLKGIAKLPILPTVPHILDDSRKRLKKLSLVLDFANSYGVLHKSIQHLLLVHCSLLNLGTHVQLYNLSWSTFFSLRDFGLKFYAGVLLDGGILVCCCYFRLAAFSCLFVAFVLFGNQSLNIFLRRSLLIDKCILSLNIFFLGVCLLGNIDTKIDFKCFSFRFIQALNEIILLWGFGLELDFQFVFGKFRFGVLSFDWRIGDRNLGRFLFVLPDYLLFCFFYFLLLLFRCLLFCYLFDFFRSPYRSFYDWRYCSGTTRKCGGRLDRDLIQSRRCMVLGVGLFQSKSLASGFNIFVAFLHSVWVDINEQKRRYIRKWVGNQMRKINRIQKQIILQTLDKSKNLLFLKGQIYY